MRAKNFVIGILVLIIVAQFIQSFSLLKKLNQKEIGLIEKPSEVYIAELTQKLRDVQLLRGKVIWQAAWFSRHMDKCIEFLEEQKGLEPIPVKHPKPAFFKGFPSQEPNERMKRLQAEPFFKPYEEPNSPPLKDLEERPVRYAICSLNLELHSLTMTKEKFDRLVSNYEQRLKRPSSLEAVNN